MNDRFRNLKLNSILALCYQVVLIATGLILPRCFLHFYGSEVNGLITSITQFLAFINLCDLGISAVVSSAYYKPIAEKDTYMISKIFVYSKRFFKTIGLILMGYIVLLLFVYPTLFNNTFDYWFKFTLIAAMGISQLGQYFIGVTYQLLLNSDQKSYVHLIVNGSTLLCNTITSIILMCFGANVQVVKLATSLIYLMRPLMMCWYVKKNYKLDHNVPIDSTIVMQKKSGIIQHIAYVIYENTDVMVLTIFSTLKNVSIYSVYTLVTNSIKQIITAATTGVQALLGNMIANKEQEDLKTFFSFYNWGIHTISSLLFTVTGLLIVPFVSIYTLNVTDANYHTPVFAILITIAYYLSSIRNCNYVLIRASGHYQKTQAASLVEVALNLIISVICVFNFSLIGVAIGTVTATLFFVIYEVVYFSKNIVFISSKYFLKLFLTDLFGACICVALATQINVFKYTLSSWILQAILVSTTCCCVFLMFQLLFYRDNLKLLKTKILKRTRR